MSTRVLIYDIITPNMSTHEKISVNQIVLDTNNPRHISAKNQTQSLSFLIKNNPNAMYTLAESIVEHGLSPTDLPIVYKKSKTKYIMLEGNRRLGALLLLDNPKQIKDEKLRTRFAILKRKNSKNVPKKIYCVVYNDKNDPRLKYWIQLKHTGQNDGAGVVQWKPDQKNRFLKKAIKKDAYTLLLFNYADKKNISRKNIDESSLKRLLSTPQIRKKIGINISNNKLKIIQSDSVVTSNIKKMFKKLSEKSFKVPDIYYVEQRIKWINDVIKDDPRTTTKTNTATKSRPTSTSRDYVFPYDFDVYIKNNKINDIYNELKSKLYLNNSSDKSVPNAVSLMIRGFLEFSLDEYMCQHNLKCKEKHMRGNKNNECSIPHKIELVCDDMSEKHYAVDGQLKNMRILVKGHKNDPFHIHRYNEFAHSRRTTADAITLKTHWNNIQEFFEILWDKTK